jgi:hypothetical protein
MGQGEPNWLNLLSQGPAFELSKSKRGIHSMLNVSGISRSAIRKMMLLPVLLAASCIQSTYAQAPAATASKLRAGACSADEVRRSRAEARAGAGGLAEARRRRPGEGS